MRIFVSHTIITIALYSYREKVRKDCISRLWGKTFFKGYAWVGYFFSGFGTCLLFMPIFARKKRKYFVWVLEEDVILKVTVQLFRSDQIGSERNGGKKRWGTTLFYFFTWQNWYYIIISFFMVILFYFYFLFFLPSQWFYWLAFPFRRKRGEGEGSYAESLGSKDIVFASLHVPLRIFQKYIKRFFFFKSNFNSCILWTHYGMHNTYFED